MPTGSPLPLASSRPTSKKPVRFRKLLVKITYPPPGLFVSTGFSS